MKIAGNDGQSNKNDFYLLVLYAIVQASSDHVLLLNPEASDTESIGFNQRKWVEVIIDFILNIRETRMETTESEYVNQFNYNQVHSTNTLLFLFKVYDSKKKLAEWNFLDYFMTLCLGSCIPLRVSSFLVQYVEKIVNTHIESLSGANISQHVSYVFKTITVYLKTLIRQDTKFDMAKNTNINSILASILVSFRKSLDFRSPILPKYLDLFTGCMFSLYDDDSVYYDDQNILAQLVEILENLVLVKGETSEAYVSALVYLSCLGYKSNLVGNELVERVYNVLNKESAFKKLLAVYSRYLLNYGFYDALGWIQTAHHTWNKFYSDFKLVRFQVLNVKV